jgi:hypothetical protein
MAYIDDGAGNLDHEPQPGHSRIRGVRVKLLGDSVREIWLDDYLAVTGVLTVVRVDPDAQPNSGDEFYAYQIMTSSASDWDVTNLTALPGSRGTSKPVLHSPVL